MVRSMDSASGRRLWVSDDDSDERPERLPGGYVVGEAGDGLQFGGFKGCAGYLGFGGVLRGVKESAERDGDLLAEGEADFAGQLVLEGDPGLVGARLEVEDGGATDGGCGETGDEGEERVPLEGGEVGVFDGRRDGIEEGHVLLSS